MNDSTSRPFATAARCLVAAALGAATPLAAAAQAPAFRVADINTRPVVHSSSPRQFHAAGDLTFFVADGDAGPAVWRTDASAEGTVRLFALATGALQHAAAIDGGYLLIVDHQTHRALVRSDGTADGTHTVATLANLPGWRTPEAYAAHGGALFFVAGDPTTGEELWRSDGTAAGTRLLVDVRPGSRSSEIRFIGSAGETLFFSAEDGMLNGPRLWSTDGSFAGTWRLSRTYVTPGARSAVLDEVVYFVGTKGSSFDRPELWRSDGTAAGTYSVRPGLLTRSLLAVGDRLFLAAADPLGPAGIWRSDGTADGTALVFESTTPLTSDLDLMADAGGALLFRIAGDPEYVLWRSDGTTEGTQPLATLPRPYACTGAIAHDGILWLVIDDTLWRSDGTTAGTGPLAPTAATRDPFQSCAWPLVAGAHGGVVFAGNGGEGVELWHSDGTADGSAPLRNLADDTRTASADPSALTAIGDAVYFLADDARHGRELWRSDGSEAGTHLVADLRPGPASAFSAFASPFVALAPWVCFVADDGAGSAVWRTDGTPAGTARLTSSDAASAPRALTAVDGTLFFLAGEPAGGVALWRSDGTAAGTARVRSLPDGSSARPAGNLVAVAGELFLSVGTTLWRSDGRAEGTGPVLDLPGDITYGTALDGRLYLGVSRRDVADPWGAIQLWRSDGTAGGTEPITQVDGASSLSHLTSLQDVLFFVSWQRVWGWSEIQDALWRNDGLNSDSRKVATLGVFGLIGREQPPVVVDDHLYFLGGSNTGRIALRRTDSVGTVETLATFDSVTELVVARGRVLLLACERPGDCGFWKSDGTPSGTRPVATADEDFGAEIAVAGDLAYFTVADPLAGRELWALPLSALGGCGDQSCGECAGDCDGDAAVDVAELLAMVRAMLDGEPPPCQAGDADRSGDVTVDEAVAAIGRALDGCE